MRYKIRFLLTLKITLIFAILGQLCYAQINNRESIPVSVVPYLNRIAKISKGRIVLSKLKKIHFSFKNLRKEKDKNGNYTVGKCYDFSYPKKIELDLRFWKEEQYLRKLTLLLHEIGHCYCFREHTTGKFIDECPNSLMNFMMPNNSCLKNHYKYYTDEVFNGCNND